MKVNIKKLHPDAVIPKYAKDGDAGMDLTATSKKIDEYGNASYGTGLAIEIPIGYVGLIFPRSSVCKYTLSLSNAVGVIDSGYRGEISCKFKPTPQLLLPINPLSFLREPLIYNETYDLGDRIAQIIIMPIPSVTFNEVDELSDTDRGDGGYGSSGK
jgi:dUTP pyrophosphatase